MTYRPGRMRHGTTGATVCTRCLPPTPRREPGRYTMNERQPATSAAADMENQPQRAAVEPSGAVGYLLPDEPNPAHWFWIELGPRIRRRPRCEGAED